MEAPFLTSSFPAPKSFFFVFLFVILLQIASVRCQKASTDPSEVVAINSIISQWSKPWNISGDPCSLKSDRLTCDCSYNNGSTCHIIQLVVMGQDMEGVLSEDIGALTYLLDLWLDRNLFSGPLPYSIGKLTNLRTLSIANNAFSGAIPKELGSLTKLFHLSICPNNFSGTLPPELGNLVNLQGMFIPNCGDVGGEIPSNFANFVNIKRMWLSGNPFTGKIPDFIGNWSKLLELRIEGNSFEGPIPPSFANLTSITFLWITDLSNGSSSSSLGFIKNMKNLTTLVLRSAMISDSIPSEISELGALKFIDLSFNKLKGQIPSALFNMSPLNNLFLGNNSLSGTLPPQKSSNLSYVDLSYNELSGDLPEWVTADSKVNIVANNFIFSDHSTNISYSSNYQALRCLQRNFTCSASIRPHSISSTSIDCGGSGAAEYDSTTDYFADSEVLGHASYSIYFKQTWAWAVSNTGVTADNLALNSVQRTTESILNTDKPDVFRTSRASSGSLRYYCLGLENGPYNLTLMFAEISIPDRRTNLTSSLRKRKFDIYVQGTLQVKDFDIAKEAGGVFTALEKNFLVNVTENYLEIHLLWAGKGTCFDGVSGPSIAGIKVFSDRNSTTPSSKKKQMVVGLSVAIVLASLLIVVIVIVYIIKKKSNVEEDTDLIGIGSTFSYSELRNATGDFNEANKLGQGGFGPVYKGLLFDGRPIAVKQLSVSSRQGKCEFLAEIAIISAVRHQNLVKLYGCCIDKNHHLLVYEYLEKKSLDQALFRDESLHLDWSNRFKICLGTARGLAYLHEDLTPRIVHRDIKASNILLDAELCPKISDFGLAKLFDDRKTHISTRIAGTIGYLAPEYAMFGHLTEKVDIFGFGVVALEILSGRPNTINSSDNKTRYLLELAWDLYENDRCSELVDPKLEEFDEEEVVRLVTVALWCTQSAPGMRPPMSRVIAMLRGDIEVSPVTSKPNYLTDMSLNELPVSSFLSGEEPSTSLLEGR